MSSSIVNKNIEYLEEPVKSLNDKKQYRVIKLCNGLKALLIADTSSESNNDKDDSAMHDESDATKTTKGTKYECNGDKSEEEDKREEEIAACCLCIGVGSLSDPPEIPGMAHFLEHMLFMGSEKFPQEDDFYAYVEKFGGFGIALTEYEHTFFRFDVQENHLLPTLTRFAQFFISPLMKRDAISRGREAVESEFQTAFEVHKKKQFFHSVAQDNHPIGRFMFGNSVTLKDNVDDDKLYEELHKFRKRHYSAHRMTLAIQARLPLETLEKYVIECFSDVPTNGLPPDDFTIYKKAVTFNTDKFNKIYKSKPLEDYCSIEITWSMPPLLDSHKSKPHRYVSWVIGHKGKGSLFSYLRNKLWCLELYCGDWEYGFHEYNSMYSFFKLCLNLTEEGHKNLDKVLDAVFSYINMFRKAGPQRRIYDEICQIEETKFRFIDEENPTNYVEKLSQSMRFFEPKEYITGDKLYFEYDPEGIEAYIEHLHPENMNILIFDRKFNEDDFDDLEPWFKTKYKVEDIPKDSIAKWRTIEPFPDFCLPLPNLYLADNFDSVSLPREVPDYPKKILENEGCEIWYRPDPKFRKPECYMYFYFISPLTSKSVKTISMTELYTAMMNEMLREELCMYMCYNVGRAVQFEDTFDAQSKGIEVQLSGFNQKVPLFLQTIIKYIANSPNLITKELFEVTKKLLLKDFCNEVIEPRKLAEEIRFCILIKEYTTVFQKHAALIDIEFEEFQVFVKEFLSNIFLLGLVQGNIGEEEVLRNVRNCTDILKCKAADMPVFSIVEIPKGLHEIKVKNINKMDVNSTVTYYYQFDNQTHELSALVDFIYMIMYQLITKEKLDDDVSCTPDNTYGVYGYSMVVDTQADKYTTEYAYDRMEVFLESFKEKLATMSDEEFKKDKDTLIKERKNARLFSDLWEEVERNWKEIKTRDFVFDRKDKEVEAIEEISLEKLKSFLQDHMLDERNVRKLIMHVIGSSDKMEHETEVEGKESLKLDYVEEPRAENSRVHRIVDIEGIDFPIKRVACE